MKNVLATGSCELQTRGRRDRLYNPHIVTDESKGWAPLPVKLILGLIAAPQHMRLSLERTSPGSTKTATAPAMEVHNAL